MSKKKLMENRKKMRYGGATDIHGDVVIAFTKEEIEEQMRARKCQQRVKVDPSVVKEVKG